MLGPSALPPGPARGEQPALELRLLGPVESAADLPAGKPVVLLAALAAFAGEVIGVERLAGYVWTENPPANQRATLQTYVMRLRRALGDAAVVTVGGGYLLGLPAERTDIGLFTGLIARAAQCRTAGRTDDERALLGSAMALWRGQPFVDLEAPRLRAEAGAALTETWADAFERAAAIDLGRGAVEGIVGRLRAAVQRFPMRESLWALLLRALRDTNRRAEALTEYHRVRTLLDSELGVLPGPELSAIYQELLVEPARGTTPWRVTARQLPRVLPDFTGRSAELDTVDAVIDARATVVVLWGMAGIGKSALAFSAAHSVRERYPDGQWYVSLAGGTSNPLSAYDAIAELLMSGGVDAAAIPPSATARAGLFRSLTAGRRVLLLLDNVEDIGQVLPLIPGTPDSLVLITSRGALPALAGAHRVHLPPLTEDDAVAVLGELLGPSRVRSEDGAARELARLCGGLPLALRMLGARLGHQPHLPLATVARRLRHEAGRLDELSVGDRGVRPSLALSRAGLEPAARAALARMALLPRAFPAFALGALADGGDGVRLVESLIAAGLLEFAGVDESGMLTYRAHDLVACYGVELLAEADPAAVREDIGRLLDAVLAHSAPYYRYPDLAGGWLPPDLAFPPDATGPANHPADLTADLAADLAAEHDAVTWLRAHGDLVLAALEAVCRFGWCAAAGTLADLVLPTMADCGRATEVVATTEALRDAAAEHGARRLAARAQYLTGRAVVWVDPAQAAARFRRCAAEFTALGCGSERVQAATAYACSLALAGEPAREIAAQTVRAAREHHEDDDYLVGFALHGYGFVLMREDRPGEAVHALEGALARASRHGNPLIVQQILRRLSDCYLGIGEIDAATDALRRAREITVTPRSRSLDGGMHYAEARVLLARGESEPSLRHVREAIRAARDAGYRGWWPYLVTLLADAHRAAGRPGVADALLARLLPERGDPARVAPR